MCILQLQMATVNKAKEYFTQQLMHWHEHDNVRELPWKGEKDAYKIWLSEIILQQTRAEQGRPYYERFIEAYPTVSALAEANDEEVFRLWQGLGYYNRCRNMLAAARIIVAEYNSNFPDGYDDILSLKGIGPYTAAAIASFAFNLPHAVVDGNVYRVLSRYFGIETPVDSTEGKKQFYQLANDLLDRNNPAAFNQAIMDLGAVVCKPVNPACDECPLPKKCLSAENQELKSLLPVKSKKTAVRKRYFHYILFEQGDKIWIHQRKGKDIWQNLYEPYLLEADKALSQKELVTTLHEKGIEISRRELTKVDNSSQRLTHRIIRSYFYIVRLESIIKVGEDGKWVEKSDLASFAFPKTLVSFFEKSLYF